MQYAINEAITIIACGVRSRIATLTLTFMIAVCADPAASLADVIRYRYTGILREFGSTQLGLDGRRFALELDLDTNATPIGTQTIENSIEVATYQTTEFTLTATGYPPATSSVLVNIYDSLDPTLNGDYVYFIGFQFDTPELGGWDVNLNTIQLPPSTFNGTQPQPFSSDAVEGFSAVFYAISPTQPSQVLIEEGKAEAVLIAEPSTSAILLAGFLAPTLMAIKAVRRQCWG
jgi:hypothetical protein